MAFFTYLDASGDAIDPKIRAISVGGFVGHEDDWARFEDEWPETLSRFGVTELHMREYAQSRGQFVGWSDDPEKRANFIAAIAKVINQCQLQPIGATIPLSIYRLFNRHYFIEEALGSPYTMAATSSVMMSVDWRNRYRTTEPMLFFIERGDNEQSDLRHYLKRILWDADPEYQVAEPVIMPKQRRAPDGSVQYVYPFQACDFIAYEQAKAITDMIVNRKMTARRSFRSVMRPIEEIPDGRTYWLIAAKDVFESRIATGKIQRRFNNFIGGRSDRASLIPTPLCYLGETPVVAYITQRGYLEDDR